MPVLLDLGMSIANMDLFDHHLEPHERTLYLLTFTYAYFIILGGSLFLLYIYIFKI